MLSSSFLIITAVYWLITLQNVSTQSIFNQNSYDSERRNRDDEKASFPIVEDFRRQTGHITEAHEVLRVALRDFLDWKDANLTLYINKMRNQSEPFYDEFDQIIPHYRKVFSFISEQVDEVRLGNYAVKQFDKDRYDLCSVARYLSNQKNYPNRQGIIQLMGKALGQDCDPCIPYRRKQHEKRDVFYRPDNYQHQIVLARRRRSNMPCPKESSQGTAVSITTSTPPNRVSSTVKTTVAPTAQSTTASTIIPDFSPCSFDTPTNSVDCKEVSLKDVKDLFNKRLMGSMEIFKLTLQLPWTGEEVPDNLMGFHQVGKKILLICPKMGVDADSRIKLKVNVHAFKSSREYVETIHIEFCDMSQLDFSFLEGFSSLKVINIWPGKGLHKSFASLPALPSLTTLAIMQGNDESINTWSAFPPPFVNGIVYLHLVNQSKMNDSTFERILNWVLLSSADTLQELSLHSNQRMTTIPSTVSFFTQLTNLDVNNNYNGLKLPVGSLRFSSVMEQIHLRSSNIKEIGAEAFQGDFTHTTLIDLKDNRLARIEASVFLPVLQQMSMANGVIDFDSNPFDCVTDPCHLLWLIRDHRSLLLKNTLNARCSANGTLFEGLNHMTGFDHCSLESL